MKSILIKKYFASWIHHCNDEFYIVWRYFGLLHTPLQWWVLYCLKIFWPSAYTLMISFILLVNKLTFCIHHCNDEFYIVWIYFGLLHTPLSWLVLYCLWINLSSAYTIAMMSSEFYIVWIYFGPSEYTLMSSYIVQE